jgi:hypothetical protein
MNVTERGKNRGALFIIAPLVIALIAVCIDYDPFHLINSSPEPGGGGLGHPPYGFGSSELSYWEPSWRMASHRLAAAPAQKPI